VGKRTDSPGLGSLSSGALTATSLLVVAGVSAAVGILIAREFGRTAETDGLLSAYGVFIVIAIAAQAIRVALLPALARARREERLAGELAGYAIALVVIATPLVLVAEIGAEELARLLTGGDTTVARDAAADSLRWMVPAAAAHLFTALAASGLAALDDYTAAAFGYAAGSMAGLVFILARVEPDGVIAVAWGMTLNSTIALLVPTVALAGRAARTRMPPRAVRPSGPPVRARFELFAVGTALPLALQLLYVVCLPFAARQGTGAATSFVYAYIAGSALVAVTAGAVGLVTSVPLTRSELTPASAAHHVVATSWLALVLVGAAVGVFALAGADVVEAVLGNVYGGGVGKELSRLIVVFGLWMIASIGVSVTFPLAFVVGRTRRLPLIAVTALALQMPLAWGLADVLQLYGLAFALALTTGLVLGALLVELGAFAEAVRGLLHAAGVVTGIGVAAFLPVALVFGSFVSAAFGLLLYVVLLALIHPRGLATSWQYLRALG
jgi:hypothetical protein